jgi:hypothetical protein
MYFHSKLSFPYSIHCSFQVSLHFPFKLNKLKVACDCELVELFVYFAYLLTLNLDACSQCYRRLSLRSVSRVIINNIFYGIQTLR